MTRRVLKYILLGTAIAGAMSACNGLNGIQLNSNVLAGLGGGLAPRDRGDTPGAISGATRAPEAPPEVSQEPLSELGSGTAGPQQGAVNPPVAVAPQPVQPTPAPITGGSDAPSFSGAAQTVAGLGDPGRGGLWMETPLVKSPRAARLSAPNGKSVVVTLEPIAGDTGSGSRLSIGAMRALGLPLTELVELQVGPA